MLSPICCIDAGHGGKDPGAYDGVSEGDALDSKESFLNLEVALNLETALKRCGFVVYMTRRDNLVYHTPSERAEMANSWGVTRFIGIHFNSTSVTTARGIEILHYPSSVNGIDLAKDVYKYVTPLTPWEDRGLKPRSDLTVLSETEMPAIIVEGGFLTNTQEEQLVNTTGYKTFLAEAIAQGVCEHFGLPYVATKPEAGTSLQEQLVLSKGQVAELQEEINALYAQYATLEDVNTALRGDIAYYEQTLTTVKASLERVEGEKLAAEQKYQDLATASTQMQEEIDRLVNANATYAQQLDALRVQLKSAVPSLVEFLKAIDVPLESVTVTVESSDAF